MTPSFAPYAPPPRSSRASGVLLRGSLTPSTPLNMAMVSGVRTQATQQLLAQQLRQTCADLDGASKLGYSHSDIGTKSIRSGAAMALFLHNHPVSRIMILGRWSSDAFLACLHPSSGPGMD